MLHSEGDRELERRGHSFLRYADDFIIFVKSRRAAERVLASVSDFLTGKLRLKVNETKSRAEHISATVYLGYRAVYSKRERRWQIWVSDKSRKRLYRRIRKETGRWGRGRSAKETITVVGRYLLGWYGYYQLSENIHQYREFDGYIRRRTRCMFWRQWGTPRTRRKRLLARGLRRDLAEKLAATRKGPWRASLTPNLHMALTNDYLLRCGLPSLLTFRQASLDSQHAV